MVFIILYLCILGLHTRNARGSPVPAEYVFCRAFGVWHQLLKESRMSLKLTITCDFSCCVAKNKGYTVGSS